MTYNEALKFIHSLPKFGKSTGLERIKELLDELDNPQNGLKFIHIAGTNGKGSVCALISNILISSGKNTGLFISPYIIDFCERIQVNGQFISKSALAEFTEKVCCALQNINKKHLCEITEFEFITAVAMLYFKYKECDVVVLETGLGGRFDATNSVENKIVTVITHIALDHMAVLGDDIEKIAFEKCGILRKNVPLITSSNQSEKAKKTICEIAKQKGAPLIIADLEQAKNVCAGIKQTKFEYMGIKAECPLLGKHQVENITCAVRTALFMGIEKKFIENGIKNTFFPARLEVVSASPLIIIDGAHNPDGAEVLCNFLKENKIIPVTVLGMMKDKNTDEVVKKIASVSKSVVTVDVKNNPRSESANVLKEKAKIYCTDVFAANNYSSALDFAKKKCKENDSNLPVLICGSLYLASDIRQMLK